MMNIAKIIAIVLIIIERFFAFSIFSLYKTYIDWATFKISQNFFGSKLSWPTRRPLALVVKYAPAFLGSTDPPYKIRTRTADLTPKISDNILRIKIIISPHSSEVAARAALRPIAQTGS